MILLYELSAGHPPLLIVHASFKADSLCLTTNFGVYSKKKKHSQGFSWGQKSKKEELQCLCYQALTRLAAAVFAIVPASITSVF